MMDVLRAMVGLPPSAETQKTKGVTRSSKWPRVRDKFLDHNPTCAACGFRERGKLNVHHCKPFADYPELELRTDNLLTLCEGPMACHLRIGHCGSWTKWNPSVRADAFYFKRMLDNRKDRRLLSDELPPTDQTAWTNSAPMTGP